MNPPQPIGSIRESFCFLDFDEPTPDRHLSEPSYVQETKPMSKQTIPSLRAFPHQPQDGLRRRKEFPQLSRRGEGRARNVHTLIVQWWQRFPLSGLLGRRESERPRFAEAVPGLRGIAADGSCAGTGRCSGALPADAGSAPAELLGEWIKKETLLCLILDAAQNLEWPESELKLAGSSGYAFRRPVLLTVVTYCYAIGVYEAKGIAIEIAQDEILQFLCAGTFPTWQDIRHFTNQSRDLIQQSLFRTCQLAHKLGTQTGAPEFASFRRQETGPHDD